MAHPLIDNLLVDSIVSIKHWEKLTVPSPVGSEVLIVEVPKVVYKLQEDLRPVGTVGGIVDVGVHVANIVPLLQGLVATKVVRSRTVLNQKVSDSVVVVVVIKETM